MDLHSLGPVAARAALLASVENTTASPSGTGREWGLRVGCREHGRQRPRSWYLARSRALSIELSNAYFKSLGLPSWEGRSREAPPIPINPKSSQPQDR